jgi:hypothetical protein
VAKLKHNNSPEKLHYKFMQILPSITVRDLVPKKNLFDMQVEAAPESVS